MSRCAPCSICGMRGLPRQLFSPRLLLTVHDPLLFSGPSAAGRYSGADGVRAGSAAAAVVATSCAVDVLIQHTPRGHLRRIYLPNPCVLCPQPSKQTDRNGEMTMPAKAFLHEQCVWRGGGGSPSVVTASLLMRGVERRFCRTD
eukprot:COSAG05_NODE_725_length_7716_cov_46.424314_8_plen_144_part_00